MRTTEKNQRISLTCSPLHILSSPKAVGEILFFLVLFLFKREFKPQIINFVIYTETLHPTNGIGR